MVQDNRDFDAIVLGGGAAGLMCAIAAGNRGKRVLLLEHNETVGKKIRISGGGRCNFTNVQADPSRYLSQNPRFCHSALARYTPADFIAFIERHGIAYHERKLGQLFCDDSAQQIIDALLLDSAAAGVTVQCGCSVTDVEKAEGYSVFTSLGTYRAPALVVATGGLSIPKLGVSDLGYRIATQFGMNIVSCSPGLVPLTLDGDDLQQLSVLSGISFDASVSLNEAAFEGAVLITHRGLSGPAILQISSFWNDDPAITLDLFPGSVVEDNLLALKASAPKTLPKAFLSRHFSSRFAERLCQRNDWLKPLQEISNAQLRVMAEALQQWSLPVSGTEGYAKAEVTLGGVDTRGLSPKTMESRDVPGLYFIGEVMDVTGWLGGYNFQWAWSSAVAAGNAV